MAPGMVRGFFIGRRPCAPMRATLVLYCLIVPITGNGLAEALTILLIHSRKENTQARVRGLAVVVIDV